MALHFDGTRCLLEDLSGHGTRVLGEPMQKGEVPDGAYVELARPKAPAGAPFKLLEGLTLHQMVEQWERQAIEEALRVCNHHRGRAAKLLGLSRSSFFERLKAWGHDGTII